MADARPTIQLDLGRSYPLVPDDDPYQCKTCRGTGLASKYDLGYNSLSHSDELAAKRRCIICGGTGRRVYPDRNLPA
jgi:hypothetical protein